MRRYLRVERLEFAVTYLCTSRCRHCYVSEEDVRKSPNHINAVLAAEIARRVADRYGPGSVMTFGGEPLLFPEVVYAIHREAANAAVPSREVITNGFWSTREDEIREIARNLVTSGVNDISISVDCFHQEFTPLRVIRTTAESLLREGVEHLEWNPCWVVSKEHYNPYNRKTLSILDELRDLPIEVGEGNVLEPKGRATLCLKEFVPPKEKIPRGECGDMPYTQRLDSVRSIYVEPDGRVAVCNQFYIGDASRTDIAGILEDYDPYSIPEAKALVEHGIQGLIDWAKGYGVEPNPEGYYSICDVCASLRNQVDKRQRSR